MLAQPSVHTAVRLHCRPCFSAYVIEETCLACHMTFKTLSGGFIALESRRTELDVGVDSYSQFATSNCWPA